MDLIDIGGQYAFKMSALIVYGHDDDTGHLGLVWACLGQVLTMIRNARHISIGILV